MSNRTVTQLGAIVLMVPLIVPLSAQNQMVRSGTRRIISMRKTNEREQALYTPRF